MKTNLTRQREEVFTNLRASLSRLNLPVDLVEELIERHMAVAFEKGAFAFCEGNTDGMLACILSGYVNVYCPVGDGDRTLVRMAGPGRSSAILTMSTKRAVMRACSKPRLRANARWLFSAANMSRGCWPVFRRML